MDKAWIGIVMALTLCVGVFFTPVTAFAATDKDTTPPTLSAELSGETVRIQASDEGSGLEAVYIDSRRVATLVNGAATVALKDYHAGGKQVTVYAVDYAGNKSDTVMFTNPLYNASAAPTPTPPASSSSTQPAPAPVPVPVASSSLAPASSSQGQAASSSGSQSQGSSSSSTSQSASDSSTSDSEPIVSAIPNDDDAFTPDGAGEVLDTATEESKEFFTITTPDGYVYYLVIDHARDGDNVYFLNAVTEADLAGLTGSGMMPGTSAIPDAPEPEPADTSEPDASSTPEDTEMNSGGFGTIIMVLLIVAAVGGASWYLKIYRPKQQAALDDEEDFGGEDEGEDWPDEDDALADGYDYDAEEAYQSEEDVEYISEEDNS